MLRPAANEPAFAANLPPAGMSMPSRHNRHLSNSTIPLGCASAHRFPHAPSLAIHAHAAAWLGVDHVQSAQLGGQKKGGQKKGS